METRRSGKEAVRRTRASGSGSPFKSLKMSPTKSPAELRKRKKLKMQKLVDKTKEPPNPDTDNQINKAKISSTPTQTPEKSNLDQKQRRRSLTPVDSTSQSPVFKTRSSASSSGGKRLKHRDSQGRYEPKTAETDESGIQPKDKLEAKRGRSVSASRTRQRSVTPNSVRERSVTPNRMRGRSITPYRTQGRSVTPKRARRRSVTPKRMRGRSVTPNRTRGRSVTPKRARGKSVTPNRMRGRSVTPNRTQGRSVTPKRARGRSVTPKRARGRSVTPNRMRGRSVTPNRTGGRSITLKRGRGRSVTPKRARGRSVTPKRATGRSVTPKRNRRSVTPNRIRGRSGSPNTKRTRERSVTPNYDKEKSVTHKTRDRSVTPNHSRERSITPNRKDYRERSKSFSNVEEGNEMEARERAKRSKQLRQKSESLADLSNEPQEHLLGSTSAEDTSETLQVNKRQRTASFSSIKLTNEDLSGGQQRGQKSTPECTVQSGSENGLRPNSNAIASNTENNKDIKATNEGPVSNQMETDSESSNVYDKLGSTNEKHLKSGLSLSASSAQTDKNYTALKEHAESVRTKRLKKKTWKSKELIDDLYIPAMKKGDSVSKSPNKKNGGVTKSPGIRTRLSTGSIHMNGTMTVSTVKEKNEQEYILKQIEKESAKTAKKRSSSGSGDGMLLDHPPPKKRKIGRNDGSGEDNRNDYYCWLCHKEGTVVCCELCPRVYHTKCLDLAGDLPNDWVCPECEQIMRADCTDTCSKSMEMLTLDQLCTLLLYALDRMQHAGSDPFQKPVDLVEVSNYSDYVFNPMDLETIGKNVRKKQYGSTEAFLADTKWILHNCIIYNGAHNKITGSAKMIVKICKHEMNEIELCPDCYLNSCIRKNNEWFAELCRTPHTLVWAKLKGYPFWPAKALREEDGQVDVRFFGAHDRSWVPVSQCFLLSKNIPTSLQKGKKNAGLDGAIHELNTHVHKLRDKFGHFEYAPFRTPYDKADAYKPTKYRPPSDPTQVSKPFVPVTLPHKSKPNILKHSRLSCKTAAAVRSKYNAIVSLKKMDFSPTKAGKSFSIDNLEEHNSEIEEDEARDTVDGSVDADKVKTGDVSKQNSTDLGTSNTVREKDPTVVKTVEVIKCVNKAPILKDKTEKTVNQKETCTTTSASVKKSFVSMSIVEQLEKKIQGVDDGSDSGVDTSNNKPQAESISRSSPDEKLSESVNLNPDKGNISDEGTQKDKSIENQTDTNSDSVENLQDVSNQSEVRSEAELEKDTSSSKEKDLHLKDITGKSSVNQQIEKMDESSLATSASTTNSENLVSMNSYKEKLQLTIANCKEKLGADNLDDLDDNDDDHNESDLEEEIKNLTLEMSSSEDETSDDDDDDDNDDDELVESHESEIHSKSDEINAEVNALSGCDESEMNEAKQKSNVSSGNSASGTELYKIDEIPGKTASYGSVDKEANQTNDNAQRSKSIESSDQTDTQKSNPNTEAESKGKEMDTSDSTGNTNVTKSTETGKNLLNIGDSSRSSDSCNSQINLVESKRSEGSMMHKDKTVMDDKINDSISEKERKIVDNTVADVDERTETRNESNREDISDSACTNIQGKDLDKIETETTKVNNSVIDKVNDKSVVPESSTEKETEPQSSSNTETISGKATENVSTTIDNSSIVRDVSPSKTNVNHTSKSTQDETNKIKKRKLSGLTIPAQKGSEKLVAKESVGLNSEHKIVKSTEIARILSSNEQAMEISASEDDSDMDRLVIDLDSDKDSPGRSSIKSSGNGKTSFTHGPSSLVTHDAQEKVDNLVENLPSDINHSKLPQAEHSKGSMENAGIKSPKDNNLMKHTPSGRSSSELNKKKTDENSKTVDKNSDSKTVDKNSNSKTVDKNSDSKAADKNSDSKTIDKNSDSKTVDKNSDSKTIGKNSESKTISKNSDSKTVDKNSDSKTVDKNSDSKTIGKNSDSKTVDKNSKSSSKTNTPNTIYPNRKTPDKTKHVGQSQGLNRKNSQIDQSEKSNDTIQMAGLKRKHSQIDQSAPVNDTLQMEEDKVDLPEFEENLDSVPPRKKTQQSTCPQRIEPQPEILSTSWADINPSETQPEMPSTSSLNVGPFDSVLQQVQSHTDISNKYMKKMLTSIQQVFNEMSGELDQLQDKCENKNDDQAYMQIEYLKWNYKNELNEVKHNFNLTLGEMQAGWASQKEQLMKKFRSQLDIEIKKVQSEKDQEKRNVIRDMEKKISEVKKKQWCAQCQKEALFYCCWNTSYCDYPCQQAHWPQHAHSCLQTNKQGNTADKETDKSMENSNQPHILPNSVVGGPGDQSTSQIITASSLPKTTGKFINLHETLATKIRHEEEKRGEGRQNMGTKFVPGPSPMMQNFHPGHVKLQPPSSGGLINPGASRLFLNQGMPPRPGPQPPMNNRMMLQQPMIQQALYPVQVARSQPSFNGTIIYPPTNPTPSNVLGFNQGPRF